MSESVNSKGLVWGCVLIAMGILFLLDQYNILDFGDVVAMLWPVALIAIGIRMIMKHRGEPSGGASRSKPKSGPETSSAVHLSRNKLLGDNTVRITSKDFSGGSFSTLLGDTVLDLSEMTLAEGEAVVTLSGLFGDIRVTLPARTEWRLETHLIWGDVRVPGQKEDGFFLNSTYKSDGYDKAAKRVYISASQLLGEIIVEETSSKAAAKVTKPS